jgi:hypothetical protein
MGAREHEGGIEVVQELHVVSSVLGRTPFVGLWRTPRRRSFFLRGRRHWSGGGGVGRSSHPALLPEVVCLTLTRVEAVLKACNASLGPRDGAVSTSSSAIKAFNAALNGPGC